MNGKIKAGMIVTLVLAFVASAMYVAPTLAYMSGTTNQTGDREIDRTRDRDCARDCVYDCERDQNQTQVRLQLQECATNQTNVGTINWQYQYEHQHRHQNMLSP